ncbi:ppk5, partial [Symbiodinium microadriaticum]
VPEPRNALGGRKGTGFVLAADLPMSDDEDEEEDEVPSSSHSQPSRRNVGFTEDVRAQAPSDGGGKAARKGTGFVSPADLPSDDEEEDQEASASSAIFGGGEARRPERPDRPASSPGRRGAPQERERLSAQGLRPMLPACKTT